MITAPAPSTIAGALRRAKTCGVDRLDARMLLAHILERPRTWLVAHDDATLDTARAQVFDLALARRAAGEPLAYLLGQQEFHGLMLQVNASVLVPRPDTEVLVDWALTLLAGELAHIAEPRVADLGTGSGAIALAVKRWHSRAAMLATDVSGAALDVARRNARNLDLEVDFHASSWWAALGGRRFHLALSNPPYIADGDAHLGALRHEPSLALISGGDGLDALKEIVGGAASHLEPGGWLLLEHGHDQAAAVQNLLRENGFAGVGSQQDLAGHARCTGGHR